MQYNLSNFIKGIIANMNPRWLTSIEYFHVFKRKLNWKNPRDLNEKINWLKFNSDTSLWTICSDKYRVREWIKQKGLEDILINLYGIWYNADEIDFKSLPKQFVMKVNNGSGDVLICKDKYSLDIEHTKTQFKNLLKSKFSNINGEPHYSHIPPCIIAEELLDCKKQPINTETLIDYKIWCFNGRPHHIWACYNRNNESVEVAVYDLNWVRHDDASIFTKHYKKAEKNLPKPKSLSKMLDIASILSHGIPQVRVDLYEIDNHPYFGEMTFTSAGGFMNFYTSNFLLKMGDIVDLSLAPQKEKKWIF